MHQFLKFIFGIKLYVSDISSVHHQLFFFYCTPSNGLCRTGLLSRSWSCSQAVSKPVWHIPLLCVQWKTFDDWQKNCTKHVVLYSKLNASGVYKKNQLDVTFCILYFSSNSCSTCFGQPSAHHQELTTAWCYSLVLVRAVAAGRWSSPVGR